MDDATSKFFSEKLCQCCASYPTSIKRWSLCTRCYQKLYRFGQIKKSEVVWGASLQFPRPHRSTPFYDHDLGILFKIVRDGKDYIRQFPKIQKDKQFLKHKVVVIDTSGKFVSVQHLIFYQAVILMKQREYAEMKKAS